MSDVCRKVVQAAQKGGFYTTSYIATAAADHEMRVKKEVDRYISELGFQLLSPFFVIRLLATRVCVRARGKKHNAGNDSANE